MTRGSRIPAETRFEVLRLANLTHLSGIAQQTGLGVSTVDAILRKADVRAARKGSPGPQPVEATCGEGCNAPAVAHGLCSRCYQRKRKEEEQAAPRRPRDVPQPRQKINPLMFAEAMYDARLTVRNGARLLDGVPIRYSDLMRRVNADHQAQGMPQPLTACPEWLVPESR